MTQYAYIKYTSSIVVVIEVVSAQTFIFFEINSRCDNIYSIIIILKH